MSRHPAEPDDEPRIVALIDLEEGIRIVSNLRGVEAAGVRNGMPVEVGFDEVDGVTLPQFRLAAGGSGRAILMACARAGRRSRASARPSSPSSPAAASCSWPPRPYGRRSRDAGLQPSDVDGLVTMTIDTNDELS